MKIYLTLVFAFLIALMALAQDPVWSENEIIWDEDNFGATRPRVNMLEGMPALIWSNSNDIWFTRMDEEFEFIAPVRLGPDQGNLFSSNYGGCDIAIGEDKLFAVFMIGPFLEAKIFIQSSTDLGETWTDPQQIMLPDSLIPFLPTVAVDAQDNPHVVVMTYDSNYENPAYQIVHSSNGGQSFGNPVSVSGLAPHEVCDCCPAHLSIDGQTQTVVFRNNDQNKRDFWIATSQNGGESFDQVTDVDPADWELMSCPSSGPDGLLMGNEMRGVWMSLFQNSKRLYYTNLNTTNQSFETKILYTGQGGLNRPKIAGSGDTIGVVFENPEFGATTSAFLYSLDGGETFEGPFDLWGDSNSFQQAPDLSYENGTFHFVYRDAFSARLWYRNMSWGAPFGLDDAANPDMSIYPNPAGDILSISSETPFTSSQVIDLMGKVVLQPAENTSRLDVSELPAGIYILKLETATGWVLKRWVKS